jgi:hypothetical protein
MQWGELDVQYLESGRGGDPIMERQTVIGDKHVKTGDVLVASSRPFIIICSEDSGVG